jgi:hypothetical protein
MSNHGSLLFLPAWEAAECDGQHFAKFVMALAADVFVKGCRLVRLVVQGSVWVYEQSS